MKHKTVIGILTYRPYTNEDGSAKENILSQCLESIYKHTDLKDACVVVANNSEDSLVIKNITDLCLKYPNLTLLNFQKNLGTSTSWNILARIYDNDIAVILNDDIMVYPFWLEVTKLILKNNPAIGSVSYDLWYTKNPFEYTVPEEASIRAYECIYPLGAAFAFRREVFDKFGGFDEQFFIGLEEADFGVRLVKAGYFNYIAGTANKNGINEYHLVRHIGGSTGYKSTDSGEKWKRKHNLPFPLNPEIEEKLKKERGKNIELKLPYISGGKVVW